MKVKVKFEVNAIYKDVYFNRMIYLYKNYEIKNVAELYEIINKDIEEKNMEYYEVVNLNTFDEPRNIDIKYISIKDEEGNEILSDS